MTPTATQPSSATPSRGFASPESRPVTENQPQHRELKYVRLNPHYTMFTQNIRRPHDISKSSNPSLHLQAQNITSRRGTRSKCETRRTRETVTIVCDASRIEATKPPVRPTSHLHPGPPRMGLPFHHSSPRWLHFDDDDEDPLFQ